MDLHLIKGRKRYIQEYSISNKMDYSSKDTEQHCESPSPIHVYITSISVIVRERTHTGSTIRKSQVSIRVIPRCDKIGLMSFILVIHSPTGLCV